MKISKKYFFASLLFLSVAYQSNADTKTKSLAGLESIMVSSIDKVEIQQADVDQIEVSSSETVNESSLNALVVTNNELVLTSKFEAKQLKDCKIIVKVKNLKVLNVTGTGEVKTSNVLKGQNLIVNCSGTSVTDLQLEFDKVIVNTSGASDTKMTGTCNELIAKSSGTSDLKASTLVSKNIVVNTSGTADADVNATESIIGNASGTSDIKYRGTPKEVKIEQSGVGSVTPMGKPNVEVNVNVFSNGDSKDDEDTTRIKIGKRKFIIIDGDDSKIKKEKEAKKEKANNYRDIVSGIDFGLSGFTHNKSLGIPSNYNLSLDYSRSFNFNANFLERHLKLYKKYVLLTSAVGIQFNRYRFKSNNHSFTALGDTTFTQNNAPNITFSKNVLNNFFLNVPLYLQINTSENALKAMHIAVGGFVGLKLGKAKNKVEYVSNGTEYEVESKQHFNLNGLQYGVSARVGYKNFGLYANYNLNEMFNKKSTLVLNPFTVGISFLGN
jgi:hypothetical protein